MIEIHETARVSPLADLEPSLRGSRYVIGPGSMIDAFVKVKPAGGRGDLIIGADCYVNSGCVLYTGHGIRLGKNVLIAANCTLAATNHEFSDPSTPIRSQGFQPSRGGIVIDDDVWIGANCVILDGAHIGNGAVIAAGSVVRGPVEPFAIMAGNPMRCIGMRNGSEKGAS
jgi:virginiamycin A acetyltransferase